MESEFPSNSQSQKVRPEKVEPKKIEKVITGNVIRQKKSLGKKAKEIFFGGGDARSIWAFIGMEIVVPQARDLMADVISQGAERMIYGEARSVGRRSGRRPSGSGQNNNFVNYTRYSANTPRDNYREEPRTHVSRKARANFDFGEIVLGTRVEAEEVVDQLFELVSKYELATVGDLYGLVGVQSNYTDEKYGWTDIRGLRIQRVRNGYLLDLPRPEILE